MGYLEEVLSVQAHEEFAEKVKSNIKVYFQREVML